MLVVTELLIVIVVVAIVKAIMLGVNRKNTKLVKD